MILYIYSFCRNAGKAVLLQNFQFVKISKIFHFFLLIYWKIEISQNNGSSLVEDQQSRQVTDNIHGVHSHISYLPKKPPTHTLHHSCGEWMDMWSLWHVSTRVFCPLRLRSMRIRVSLIYSSGSIYICWKRVANSLLSIINTYTNHHLLTNLYLFFWLLRHLFLLYQTSLRRLFLVYMYIHIYY